MPKKASRYAASLSEGSRTDREAGERTSRVSGEVAARSRAADSGFTAIQQAYFGNTALSLFVSDGDGNGLDADFVVTSFSRSEPLKEALKVSVTCKPTLVSRAPQWVNGSGGGS